MDKNKNFDKYGHLEMHDFLKVTPRKISYDKSPPPVFKRVCFTFNTRSYETVTNIKSPKGWHNKRYKVVLQNCILFDDGPWILAPDPADAQAQTILICKRSNSTDFRLEKIKLYRFWSADTETQPISGCRWASSPNFRLQPLKFNRSWIAETQTPPMFGCSGETSNDFELQVLKSKRF